ncbi:MAG TPA: hypothetical protein VGD65_08715 [Chryseosolibacter sp.]
MDIKINFVIGQISEGDFDSLAAGDKVTSKMILNNEDFKLFRYKEGDSIEVETDHGNRQWCTILHLETLPESDRVLLIFTLKRAFG